jgi:hypothetical protein
VRFDVSTVTKLAAYASRHPGMTSSSAAALLVEEGLRMDAHPGVVFREGPAGRRACLASGPDVWEVIRAVRSARAAEADLESDEVLEIVAENTNLPPSALQVAVGYYGEYADEIDRQIADADAAQERALESLEKARSLLDA